MSRENELRKLQLELEAYVLVAPPQGAISTLLMETISARVERLVNGR